MSFPNLLMDVDVFIFLPIFASVIVDKSVIEWFLYWRFLASVYNSFTNVPLSDSQIRSFSVFFLYL